MRVTLLVPIAAAALFALPACRARDEAMVTLSAWTMSVDGDSAPARPVELPAHFSLPQRDLRYRLTAHVDLPPSLRGRTLTLAIPYFTGLTTLRAAGVEVAPLDGTGWERYRSTGAHRWQLGPERTAGAALDLQLVVDHRWTQSAWFETAPRLSATPGGDAAYRFVTAFNRVSCIVSITAVLLVGFNYLLVFVVDRKRKLHGWMALPEAFSVVYYPLFQLGLPQPVFGRWDGIPMMLMLPTAIVASVHFLHLHMRLPPPSRLWAASVAGGAVLALFVGDPFHATRIGGGYVVVVVSALFLYQVAVPLRRWRTIAHRRNMLVLLTGWILLILSALPEMGVWVGLGTRTGGMFTVYWGLMVFLFVQAGVLSSDHAHSLGDSEKLNAALRARLDDLRDRHQELLAVTEALRGKRRERAD